MYSIRKYYAGFRLIKFNIFNKYNRFNFIYSKIMDKEKTETKQPEIKALTARVSIHLFFLYIKLTNYLNNYYTYYLSTYLLGNQRPNQTRICQKPGKLLPCQHLQKNWFSQSSMP